MAPEKAAAWIEAENSVESARQMVRKLFEFFYDPVMLGRVGSKAIIGPDGHAYSRRTTKQLIKNDVFESPMTRAKVPCADGQCLVPAARIYDILEGSELGKSVLRDPAYAEEEEEDFEIVGGVLVKYLGDDDSVTIPDTVTAIGDSAFAGSKLKSVVIPGSVQTIGHSAFFQNKLVSLELGENVETIGAHAFRANALESVVIPGSVQTIGERAFANNKLTSLKLGEKVETIGHSAFARNKLKSVVIPGSVQTIGYYAFAGNKLVSLKLGEKVETIGDHAFAGNELTRESIVSQIPPERLARLLPSIF